MMRSKEISLSNLHLSYTSASSQNLILPIKLLWEENLMYKAVSAMLSLLLIISLSACGGAASSGAAISGGEPGFSSSDELAADLPPIQISGDIGGEITVSAYDTMMSKAFLEDAARLFMEKYPGTTVIIETFSAMPEIKTSEQGDYAISSVEFIDDPQSRQDYINRLNTELMSGEGADVLSMDVLPAYKYAQSGQLENLAGYMEADPTFNRDDYLTNIFDAVEYRGGLWFMPINYSFNCYNYDSTLITGEAASAFGAENAVTFGELIAIAEPFFNGDEKLNSVDYPSDLWRRLFQEDFASFVDLESKTADFADGRFEALLESAVRYGEDGYVLQMTSEGENSGGWSMPVEMVETPTERVFFKPMSNYHLILQSLRDFTGIFSGSGRATIDGDDKLAGVAALSGGRVPFSSNETYGINSNSDNKVTAWAFIKFLLSEEIQLSVTGASFAALPVLNSARANKAEAFVTMMGGGADDMSALSESQSVALAQAIAGYNETVEQMSSQINSYVFSDAIVNDMIAAEVEGFFDGNKTASEAAQTLQSKVELYLNE
jgi:ABC-type glycerol-3-phosphate transport system substrate-binding protein